MSTTSRDTEQNTTGLYYGGAAATVCGLGRMGGARRITFASLVSELGLARIRTVHPDQDVLQRANAELLRAARAQQREGGRAIRRRPR